jgi:activator of HSP90 ATPase
LLACSCQYKYLYFHREQAKEYGNNIGFYSDTLPKTIITTANTTAKNKKNQSGSGNSEDLEEEPKPTATANELL